MFALDEQLSADALSAFVLKKGLPLGSIIQTQEGLFEKEQGLINVDEVKAFLVENAKATVRTRIDELRSAITGRFTQTEQDGWINTKVEAQAIVADADAPAPGLRLQAQIEGVKPVDLANAILAAAEVTERLPSIAAGMRAKANKQVDATDGSEEQLAKVLSDLDKLAEAIVAAAIARDKDALMAAVAS